jgi:hypothetical protein
LLLALAASLGIGWNAFGTRPAPAPAPGQPVTDGAKIAPTSIGVGTLEKGQRERLWEIEHAGLLLARIAFKPLADALSRADAEGLGAFCTSDFRGKVPDCPREVRVEADGVNVVRQQDDGKPPREVARAEFLERLLDYRRPFRGKPQVKLSLMGLAPISETSLDGVWRGTALLRIAGETAPGQPSEVLLYIEYEVPYPDESAYSGGGWLRACRITQSQVGRSDHYLMKEVAFERGLDTHRCHDNWERHDAPPMAITGGAYLCDFDRDGRVDLFISDLNGYMFYRGLAQGKFEDITTKIGLPVSTPNTPMGGRLTAAFADLDGDGWEDLILGDFVFRNAEGKKFVRVATDRTSLTLPLNAASVLPADFDRDGRVDLYVTRSGRASSASWLDGKSGSPTGNQLWRNLGDWQFRDVTESSGTSGGNRSVFTAVWLDADDDNWPDIYVPNEFGNGVLLINKHDSTFRETALTHAPTDFGTMGVTCGDIDNDGHIDIFSANMYSKAGSRVIGNLKPGTYPADIMAKMRSFVTGSQLHHNLGSVQFDQWGQRCQIAAVGWSYGASLADLNNDGWLDLFATCGFISQTRDKPDG